MNTVSNTTDVRPTFPWPMPPRAERSLGQMGGTEACVIVMDWRGLDLDERMVGIDVANAGGGWDPPGMERAAERLEITPGEYETLLWSLLHKGVLTEIARRWY